MPQGALRLCLINKDFARATRVAVDPGRRFVAGSVMRLTGPAAQATAGITLGGACVDEFGACTVAKTEVVQSRGREVDVDVAASSAVLMSLQ